MNNTGGNSRTVQSLFYPVGSVLVREKISADTFLHPLEDQ
jgi:hypothetical protein